MFIKGPDRSPEVLNYLKQYELINGYLPTTKVACYDLKIHRTALIRFMKELQSKGLIKKLPWGTLAFKVMG